jgi:glycosyltransferase involved in cell wall biosynthesis
MWISGDSYRKLPHAMLSAVAMVPKTRLHAAGLSARARDLVRYLGIRVGAVQELPLPQAALLQAIRRTHVSLYVTFSECCPMLPLESMAVGVPCLIGPTSHLFDDHPQLADWLVVPFPDRADVIADFMSRAIDDRDAIMRAYARYIPEYNEKARRSVAEFLV